MGRHAPGLSTVLQLPKWGAKSFPMRGFCTHRLSDPSLRETGVQADAGRAEWVAGCVEMRLCTRRVARSRLYIAELCPNGECKEGRVSRGVPMSAPGSVFSRMPGKAVWGASGELVCTKPMPCQPTHFWNDENGSKYRKAYFSKFPGRWEQAGATPCLAGAGPPCSSGHSSKSSWLSASYRCQLGIIPRRPTWLSPS